SRSLCCSTLPESPVAFAGPLALSRIASFRLSLASGIVISDALYICSKRSFVASRDHGNDHLLHQGSLNISYSMRTELSPTSLQCRQLQTRLTPLHPRVSPEQYRALHRRGDRRADK